MITCESQPGESRQGWIILSVEKWKWIIKNNFYIVQLRQYEINTQRGDIKKWERKIRGSQNDQEKDGQIWTEKELENLKIEINIVRDFREKGKTETIKDRNREGQIGKWAK